MSCTTLEVQTQPTIPSQTFRTDLLIKPSLSLLAHYGKLSSTFPPKQYTIHPTSLIKSAVLNRHKHLVASGLGRDRKMRLAADELKSTRLLKYHQSTRSRAEAEEAADLKFLAENRILTLAEEQGQMFSALDPATAIALAKATRDTLRAELFATTSKIKECISNLEVLQDSADESRARLEDAEVQVQIIVQELHTQGLDIDSISIPNIHSPPPSDLSSLPALSITRLQSDPVGKEVGSEVSSSGEWTDAKDWVDRSGPEGA